NYTDKAGEAQIHFQTKGIKMRDLLQTVRIPAQDHATVLSWGEVSSVDREASITARAELDAYRDGFTRTVPIRRDLIVDHQLLGEGRLVQAKENAGPSGDGGEVLHLPLRWEDSIVKRESRLEIAVDRAGLSALESSLLYLIEYPYGCLEQTMSRVLPMFKVA